MAILDIPLVASCDGTISTSKKAGQGAKGVITSLINRPRRRLNCKDHVAKPRRFGATPHFPQTCSKTLTRLKTQHHCDQCRLPSPPGLLQMPSARLADHDQGSHITSNGARHQASIRRDSSHLAMKNWLSSESVCKSLPVRCRVCGQMDPPDVCIQDEKYPRKLLQGLTGKMTSLQTCGRSSVMLGNVYT